MPETSGMTAADALLLVLDHVDYTAGHPNASSAARLQAAGRTAMKATEPETGFTIYSAEATRGRSCGACTACCTQVPVHAPEFDKPANVRCKHVCSKGCGIYETRPKPCRYWSCRWLFDPLTADMRRPDRAGYIVDPQFDTIIAYDKPLKALQVWVDPATPDAHRDPALRAYVAMIAEKYRVPAIVRWGSHAGFLLVAPILSAEGDWLELGETALISHEAMLDKLAAL